MKIIAFSILMSVLCPNNQSFISLYQTWNIKKCQIVTTHIVVDWWVVATLQWLRQRQISLTETDLPLSRLLFTANCRCLWDPRVPRCSSVPQQYLGCGFGVFLFVYLYLWICICELVQCVCVFVFLSDTSMCVYAAHCLVPQRYFSCGFGDSATPSPSQG